MLNNVRKIFFLSFLLVIILNGCIQQNFLTYENRNYGIRIKYPAEGGKIEFQNLLVFGFPKNTAIESVERLLNITSQEPSVYIEIQNLTNLSVTLDDYTNQNLKVLETARDYKLINASSTTISKEPAYKALYTWTYSTTKGNYKMKYLQFWTIKNNKVYKITYRSTEEQFDQFLSITQEMIDSFEFI